MTISNTIKAIAPSILLGGAIGCGISYAIDALFFEDNNNCNLIQSSNTSSISSTNKQSPMNCCDMYFGSEGYNKDSSDTDGFSHNAFDCEDSGRDLFNIKGFDKSNRNRHFYMSYLARLYRLKEDSLKLLNEGAYRYALLNSRTIVDDTLSLLLGHAIGNTYQGAKLSTKLRICEEKHLLGSNQEFINSLHGVCRVCSPRLHTIENEHEITHQQVYFTIMQSMKLLQMAEKILLMS